MTGELSLSLKGHDEEVERTEREREMSYLCPRNTSIVYHIHSGRVGERKPQPHSPLIPFLGSLAARLTWKPESSETCGCNSYLSASGNTEESTRVESRAEGTDKSYPAQYRVNYSPERVNSTPSLNRRLTFQGKQSCGLSDFWA